MYFEHLKHSSEVSGFYEEADGLIYIASGLGKYEKECVFLHERMHRICHQGGCVCWGLDDDNYLAEVHAYTGEWEAVAAEDCHALTKAYFKSISSSLKKMEGDKKAWTANLKALRKVMRTKKFKIFQKKWSQR
ncbi:hypothetical protein LCGC14_0588670 [marine sediment metagenome]|uniref:IrrE N-terminal-like domain-containing protein n=1 Tax=marine sediment metagenome TaxID=412755 RepID=A0A0F9UMI9_9ZZZZ